MKPTDNEEHSKLLSDDKVDDKGGFRWIVLLIICICVYSFRYCHNNPFSLQTPLQQHPYNLTSVQYNLLYSIYGWVNTIFPLISALLIDYIGINSSSLLFYTLIVTGQSIWMFGVIQKSFMLMLLGRAVFGSGASQFQTSRKYYAVEYFTGKEYIFAASMTLFVSRIASGTQSYITTFIYDKTKNVASALIPGLILVITSLFLFIIFLVYRNSKYTSNKQESQDTQTQTSPKNTLSKFNLNGLWNGAFDKRLWILTVALTCFYSSYVSFTNIGSSFLQSKYEYTFNEANELTPIIFFVGAFTLPICGLFCDRYGKRCQLLIISSMLLISAHLILGFSGNMSRIMPVIGLILFGLGMGIGSAILWPLVGLICTKQYLAVALGITGCLDMGFQGTSFLIVGVITKTHDDKHDQYEYVTYWVLFLAIVYFIANLMLWYYDKTQFNDRLNKKEAKFDSTKH
eukprot:246772_1